MTFFLDRERGDLAALRLERFGALRGLLFCADRAFFFVAFFAAGRRARTGGRDFFAPRRAVFAGLRAAAFPPPLGCDLRFVGVVPARLDEPAPRAAAGFAAGAFGGAGAAGAAADTAFRTRGRDARVGAGAGDAGLGAADTGPLAFAGRGGFATR